MGVPVSQRLLPFKLEIEPDLISIPYALQWMWPVPLLIGIALAPESPWWLVRKGRVEEAKKSLLRLTSLNKESNFDADDTIAMMVHTTALEEKVHC
jgi:MFS transporter, SP family, general alpha glucoside:H+ symporter